MFTGIFSLPFFAAVLVSLAWLRYVTKDSSGAKPKDTYKTFREWLPKFALKYKFRLGFAVLVYFMTGFNLVVGIIAALTTAVDVNFKLGSAKRKYQELLASEEEYTKQWLATLGPTHAARIEKIEQLFADRSETVPGAFAAEWQSWAASEGKWRKSCMGMFVKRSLAAMDNREREYLRITELLNSAADGANRSYVKWRMVLLYGEGKGKATSLGYLMTGGDSTTSQNEFEVFQQRVDVKVDTTITLINEELNRLNQDGSLGAELKAVAAESFERITQGGAGWLKPAKVKGTVFEPQSEHALHIGSFDDGTPFTYSGDGSMITIAPPGSGKTQCNVFPNLLSWKGPAVVLDISGDIYENTSKWRAENVGPVYKFSPLEPESSHCYNPLAFVRREADYIWEDSRLLAEMMIVPSNSNDPFWENEARNVLTAAIAYVCYSNPADKRPMHEVLDIMYGGEPWSNMITGLKMAVDVRVMQQNANALAGMNEKTLSSVLQTARSSLSAWTGERIARATKRSDWDPADLRTGKNPTIYIYIRPNEVESYLSLLRVFIGQHIRVLTGGAVPQRGSAPILFMLDELPRLRNMPPVDEALNIGRKYGLRLWMFAQSVGQLREAYKNADGMIGSCAVRIYMNASGADGLAEKLSEEIGSVDSFTDGQKKRLVEASDLAGPNYRDYQVVFGLNARPAKVRKDYAWKDETIKSRMGVLELEPAK